MASIVKVSRKNGTALYIAYRIRKDDGKIQQIKYRCKDFEDAKRRLADIAIAERENRIYSSYESSDYCTKALTVGELVDAYLGHHAKELSSSTLRNYLHISAQYIKPFIGNIPLKAVTTAVLQRYYDDLPNHPASQGNHLASAGNISARTVREVHKILRPAFRLGTKWELIPSNPAIDLDLPSLTPFHRKQWTTKDVIRFINDCTNEDIKVAVATMFFGTTRSGELFGLTWDCLDISVEALNKERCYIMVEKTVARLSKEAMKKSKDDIIKVFPSTKINGTTVVVAKKPKTAYSIRKIYIPNSVADLLIEHRDRQLRMREQFGDIYQDNNLVFCHTDGSPYTADYIDRAFKKIAKKIGMEIVDFYSLRHSGATAKLRATRDIKAVQHDMGHGSPDMLLKIYATICDEDRQYTAKKMNELWLTEMFGRKNSENINRTDEKEEPNR